MNLAGLVLGISLLILAMGEALSFHKKTVCRQEAWAMSFEVYSRSLFEKAQTKEMKYLQKCKILIKRFNQKVNWQHHRFEISVKGKL